MRPPQSVQVPHSAAPRHPPASISRRLASEPSTPAIRRRRTAPFRDERVGKTGVKVSALGMGGHHLGEPKSVNDAIELVHKAIDGGIEFFDNCWEYFNGKTENWLGRALAGKRDKVFLMTKVCTHGRERRPGYGDA